MRHPEKLGVPACAPCVLGTDNEVYKQVYLSHNRQEGMCVTHPVFQVRIKFHAAYRADIRSLSGAYRPCQGTNILLLDCRTPVGQRGEFICGDV